MTAATRCGFVAIVGAPNAGKSTLLNKLAGSKLSIVSPKAQTTRFRVIGILMHDLSHKAGPQGTGGQEAGGQVRAQLLLVDTPGIFRPKRKLDRAMVAAAWTGSDDADITLVLVDARGGATEGVREIAAKLRGSPRRLWLVLNKTDLVPRPRLLPLTAELVALLPVERTLMVSARSGEGLGDLLDDMAQALPEGPFLYPQDDLTDLPDRLLAAEMVREQIFLQTHEEVPYAATVETESFLEQPDGSVRIEATIYVSRAGHKGILIGDKGSRIRSIGERARHGLAALLERPVHLFLNVKERAGWDEERARLRAIGLDDQG
ncbi:GTPase Era [Lichenicoccus sp.]|uniref:GTPase Era n=1 Tax=Lichenicoccus sp. TaxID=2781899 RepID=UPI003D0BA1C8